MMDPQFKSTFTFFICFLWLALQPWFGSVGFGRDSTLIRFQLEDQFDQAWTHQDFSGHATIIVGSDRQGSEYNEIWSFAIYDSLVKHELKDSVKFLAVADTRGVPSLLKKMVKRKFPREAHRWIMIDWEGKFAVAYQFVPHECNLVVIDRAGKVVHQQSGKELDRKKLDLILGEIYTLFKIPH